MEGTGDVAVNKVAIKFLLSNGLTGSLIGSGGMPYRLHLQSPSTLSVDKVID